MKRITGKYASGKSDSFVLVDAPYPVVGESVNIPGKGQLTIKTCKEIKGEALSISFPQRTPHEPR